MIKIEEELKQSDIWDEPKKAQTLYDESSKIKEKIDVCQKLDESFSDLTLYYDMYSQGDESALSELNKEFESITSRLMSCEADALLSGEYDNDNAILTVHAGAGGTDAQDWAQMLLRMYLRWCQKEGLKTETADFSPGEEAGVKSATVIISGARAYGLLKGENGVHRLVRLSPFDSAHRRHTSFSQVEVIPERDEKIDVKINPEDIKVETYRSSGAGGQHVNKTDSAVRMIHIPTNVIVQCQNERSQHHNRITALKILKAKLFELERRQKEKELADIKGEHKKIEWGSQIRSYVMHPYSLVKDHRTGAETGNVQGVMDGAIDLFIESWLSFLATSSAEQQ